MGRNLRSWSILYEWFWHLLGVLGGQKWSNGSQISLWEYIGSRNHVKMVKNWEKIKFFDFFLIFGSTCQVLIDPIWVILTHFRGPRGSKISYGAGLIFLAYIGGVNHAQIGKNWRKKINFLVFFLIFFKICGSKSQVLIDPIWVILTLVRGPRGSKMK